ncbi:AI-2E family transporter [uncultured Clostridium sp.]|uniref:AI-2E family transporter n=1 Tax=uncultured Clostridium sp. TaxID=59620 RepID=UPI002672D2B2|nr:AI-2E family transporter [uncultured Clostridium sp.]
MNKKYIKENIFIVTYGLILFFIIYNLKFVLKTIDNLVAITLPVIFGIVLAFLLNIPMSFLERKIILLIQKLKVDKKRAFKISRAISLLLVLLIFICVITFTINIVIPEIIKSFYIFIEKAPEQIKNIQGLLIKNYDNYLIDGVLSKIQEIDGDISKIINNLVQITFSGVLNITLGITNILINFILGLIISIYILLEKETLKYQLKLLINTVATDKYKSSIIEILKLIYSKFKKYIFGQAIDSAILFIMIFISMTIFKIPYAIFISFILAICAAVPILGPLIGIIITTIIMIIAGYKNILFFILIVVLMQQIEGNIIYPIVVGNSIGLSSLYIVVVVIVFSSLFGIFGVIIGVPLCGVLYEIICKYAYKKDFIEK